MGLFNITTAQPPSPQISDSDSNSNYKYCKRCNQTLPHSDFYPTSFYCKRCHKINNALSKNKATITQAITFWETRRKAEAYRDFGLFRPDSTYYSWMMPLFFASIHEKQWHIYLYAFYLTEFTSSMGTTNTDKKVLERAEKALCKESILSLQQTALLEKKLSNESDFIKSDNVYDLSIPYITQFYKKLNPRLRRQIALFTRTKVCSSCHEEKFTHDCAESPVSFFQALTYPPKKVRIKPFHFKRDYNKRDGWSIICHRCIEQEHIKTFGPLPFSTDLPTAEEIEQDAQEYDDYKAAGIKRDLELRAEYKKYGGSRDVKEDGTPYYHPFSKKGKELLANESPTSDGGIAPAIEYDEEIFPDSP